VFSQTLSLATLNRLLNYIIVFLLPFSLFSQREINALRINQPIKIDGLLNEPAWGQTEITDGFTQITPDAGAAATHNTTVRVLYDDEAIYIGAHCRMPPELVSRVLSQRDRYNSNTDYFSLMVDTYRDKLNGFVFSVSTEGVQYDAKIYEGSYNSRLDMIWYGEVNHSDSGWTVEMKIPYNAIRFAQSEGEQIWGINFTRYDSYSREESSWNIVNPDLNNIVTQAGLLRGLENIAPGLRLFLSPYLSSYAEHFPTKIPNRRDWTYSFNGGMDVKYGINEAFTLDMTLIPDFGQVVTDNVVLNLSPFEVFFDENRPFFNEGNELFEKTGHFYSRRVGAAPLRFNQVRSQLKDNEEIAENPALSQLLNATKLSGRTSKGLGIGLFNGLSGATFATILDTVTREVRQFETSPLSNYNVLVLDQNLKNNSSITFTNTNVWRSGETYDANLSALALQLNTEDNNYFLRTNGALSQKYRNTGNEFGHSVGLSLGKQRGNFVYSAGYNEMSDTYDPNDLGFLFNNNVRNINLNAGYNIYKPFWLINRFWSNYSVNYGRLYNPNRFTSLSYNASAGITNRKFHSANMNINGTFTENYDFFEARSAGRFFIRPVRVGGGGWISSNYQRPFALDVSLFGTHHDALGWWDLSFGVSPRVRIGNKVFLVYRWDENYNFNQQGYAIPFIPLDQQFDEIIFGERDVKTTTNTIDLTYTMNNKTGMTFRLRHYWSRVDYSSFYELLDNGRLSPVDIPTENANGISYYNTNFNAFSIDMVFRWIFSPASEVNIVWKNNIFTSNSDVAMNYLFNLQNTLVTDQLNSFSIRVVYFIDYMTIHRRLKRD
jgi:hypothetical protein